MTDAGHRLDQCKGHVEIRLRTPFAAPGCRVFAYDYESIVMSVTIETKIVVSRHGQVRRVL